MREALSRMNRVLQAACAAAVKIVLASIVVAAVWSSVGVASAAAQTTSVSGNSRSVFDTMGRSFGDGAGFVQYGVEVGTAYRAVISFNVPAGAPTITAAEFVAPSSNNVNGSPLTELRNVSAPLSYSAVGAGVDIGGPTAVVRNGNGTIQLNAAGIAAVNALAAAGGGTINIGLKIQNEAPSGSDRYYTTLPASSFRLSMSRPSLTLSPTSLPSARVGEAFNQSITASGGTAPYTFAVTAGALPAGLTLSPSGTLSGAPTAGGSFNVTVTATDSQNVSGSRAYSLTVQSPTISLAFRSEPFSAVVNQPFTASLPTPTGGTAPYTFAVTGGVLPAGLTLSPAGVLSGTPTTAGFANLTIQATDSSTGTGPFTATQSYSVSVDPGVVLGTAAPAAATVGQAYSHVFTATGATAPVSFAVTAGALPAGLTLSPSGTLSGAPTAGGSFNFTVTATDSRNVSGSRAYSLTVQSPTISLAFRSEPFSAVVNQPFTASLPTPTGGTAPYTYAVTGGVLPAGLTLSPAGVLSGTPTTAGFANLTIQATDSSTGTGPFTATQSYSVSVDPGVVLGTAAPAAATVGQAYSHVFTVTGATAPVSFAVTAGALPAGLTLSPSGTLSGAPTAGGSFNFTVTATDSRNVSGSRAYSLTVQSPTISLAFRSEPFSAVVNQPFTASLPTPTGGTAPYTYAVTGGVLPAGLTLSPAGVLSGTPTTAGFANLTIQATDSSTGTGPFTATQSYSVLVDPGVPVAAPSSLSLAFDTASVTVPLTLSGGPATSVAITTPPTRGTATVTGTTITYRLTDTSYVGSDSFAYTAGNANGNSLPATVTINRTAPTLVLPGGTQPTARVGVAYSQSLAATGGSAPYTYAVTGGALPAGVTLSSAGVLSGAPTAGGAFNFTITATDSSTGTGPFSVSSPHDLTVQGSSITLSGSLAAGSRGTPYTQSVTASGGIAPYTYALSSGALPAGLTLSSTGQISGTPTAVGTFGFQIRAVDSATGAGPYAGTTDFSVTISAAAISVSPSVLPKVLEGVPFSQQFQAAGGQGTYSFAVTAGSLPAGLTLSSTGLMAGTPTAAGSFAFTVAATDTFGNTGSVALAMVIAARPDPALDPDVRGLATAQAEATRRLTSTQIDNFSRRLEQLNDGAGAQPLTMGLSLNTGLAELGRDADRRTELAAGRTLDRHTVDPDRTELHAMRWQNAGLAGVSAESSVARAGVATVGAAPTPAGGVRFWTGGAVTIGERDAETGQARVSVRSSGISVGADIALSPDFDLGFGGGLGEERADVGIADTAADARQVTGVVYASYRPQQGVHVGAMLGHGSLEFDLRRRAGGDGSLLRAERDGSATFGSIGVGYDRPVPVGRLNAYGRIEGLNATLDAYSETGSAFWALSYGERDVESLQGVIGARYAWSHEERDSTWAPGLRLEYRHEFADGGLQSIQYADWLAGPTYQIGSTGWERSEFNLGFDLSISTIDGWQVGSEIGVRLSSSETAGTLRLDLSKVF